MKKKVVQQMHQFGLCIDWETSGADFGKDSSQHYQGLSFGAVVFKTEDFTIVEEMYQEIKFNGSKWEWSEDAEKIHGLTQEYLEQNGVSQEDAAIALAELILKYWGPENKVMFLGHNPEFDIRFTNQLMNQIEIEFSVEKKTDFTSWIQLHHVVLDTSAAGFITTGIYKSDLLFEKMGFAERDKHNALEDARQTVMTCAILRELTKIGMESVGL
jgi:DNA polymerase III epsilon subunit-like protein